MKKKILLMLTIFTLLMCVFAISVSATYIYKDTEGNELFSCELDSSSIITTYEGEFPKVDAQGNALTWYVTGTTNENGNTIKTVASVLTTDATYFSIVDGEYKYITSTVTQYNVVAVNFPDNAGITKLGIENEGFRQSKTFSFNPNDTELLFLYLPKTLVDLPNRLAQGSKMIVCDIPDEVYETSIFNAMFYEAKNLREVNIPSSVVEICGYVNSGDGYPFRNAVSLERITFGPNSQLKTIGNSAFRESGLKYITLPDCVESIGEHAFSSTKLVHGPFTETSQIKTIGGRAFNGISTLETFLIPAHLTNVVLYGNNDYGPLSESTVQRIIFTSNAPSTAIPKGFLARATIVEIDFPSWITEIPARFFSAATIDDITIPDTVISIGERAFQDANVGTLRLGAGFKYFTNSIEDHHSLTYGIKNVREVYIPASFYAEAPETVYQVSYAFHFGNLSNIKFFYTGTKEQLATSMYNFLNSTKSPTDNNGKFTGATQISWADYSANPDNYASGNYIIYDYNACDAFYAGIHDERVESSYPNGYGSVGTKVSGCVHKGCTLNTKEKLSALFTSLGYSTSETDGTGISIGYRVDYDAIKTYEELTGTTLSYGMFATTKQAVGNGDIFDADGNTVSGAITLDVTKSGFTFLSLKMVGFDTENSKEVEFAIGAYAVTTQDGKKSYSYIQEDTPLENQKYAFIKYSDYVK